MPIPFISAIVLAAGESRRMGARNKLLLPFGGKPLLAHIVETVAAAAVDEVIVVLGHEAARVRASLPGAGVTVVHNPDYRDGMTTSIHAGVAAAAPEAEGFMICLSDLPLIETAEFDRLLAAFRAALRQDAQAIVRPVHAGTPGNPVLFAAHYRAALLAHQGMTGCRGLIKQNRARVTEVAMDTDHVLRDVDTPEAYDALAPDSQ